MTQAQKNNGFPGSLERAILRTLSLRDLRGYGIVQFVRRLSGNEFLSEEGSLYPALQRLELNGWIDGVWGVTSDHQRAKIYKITKTGRKQLATPTFHTCNLQVVNALVPNLRGVKSCVLVGCVVTSGAFSRQRINNLSSGEIPVNVCMEPTDDLGIDTARAESLVSMIFSRIGVNLTWRTELSDCDQAVRTAFKIRWVEAAPSRSPAGALAAARLFGSSEGSVTLYEVPLQRFLRHHNANAPEVVLAYVLAHELAHVMQGVEHHSDSGILKAIWSDFEYDRMQSHSLTFTAKDVNLIHAGLDAKRLNIASR